jgi:hypothetical protein
VSLGVPPSTLHKEAPYVAPVLGRPPRALECLVVADDEVEADGVNGVAVFSGEVLEGARQKGLEQSEG